MKFEIEVDEESFSFSHGGQIIASYERARGGYKGKDRHDKHLQNLCGVLGLDPDSAEDEDLEALLDQAAELGSELQRKIYG